MNATDLRTAVLAAYRARRNTKEPAFFIGQAPGAPRGGDRPLFPYPRGCAGHRLFALTGWSLEEYLGIEKFNTLSNFPGRAKGRGDAFSLATAREAAAAHLARLDLRASWCVFVGKANARAYPWELPPPMQWRDRWVWIPHTSGLVPFWNDAINRASAGAMFRGLRSRLFGEEPS